MHDKKVPNMKTKCKMVKLVYVQSFKNDKSFTFKQENVSVDKQSGTLALKFLRHIYCIVLHTKCHI